MSVNFNSSLDITNQTQSLNPPMSKGGKITCGVMIISLIIMFVMVIIILVYKNNSDLNYGVSIVAGIAGCIAFASAFLYLFVFNVSYGKPGYTGV